MTKVNPVSIEQKMALIEVINIRLLPTDFHSQKSLTAEAQQLNLLKLKKLQKHFEKLDLSSKISREALDDFASDLMIILKGPTTSLLDYFTRNKSKRMNERLMRMVQEDMLLIGLKGMLERIPEKESYTRLEQAKYLTKRFFQYKIWKYFVLPYDLPWLERVKIPEELLEKIMVEGLEAHNQELITHLNKQGMIDHYERMRKVYKPMALGLGYMFYFNKFENRFSHDMNQNQEEEKKKLLEDFENLSLSIMDGEETFIVTEDKLKAEQLKSVINTYKQKYKEDPSPEELEEMKASIFKK